MDKDAKFRESQRKALEHAKQEYRDAMTEWFDDEHLVTKGE
jgi:hypothetical protein